MAVRPPFRPSAWVALLLVVPMLAGCAGDAPTAKEERVTPGATGSAGRPTSDAVAVSPPPPRGTSERWHFHDYWKGNPTITLMDANVTFNVSAGPDGAQVLSAIVHLPHGVIVPPETGFLTFNVTWEGAPGGLVNLTYRPADATGFFPFADLARGVPALLPTTESNTDVPHRQESAWAFNLTAAFGGEPPALPPRDVRFTVNATIGRPLFIDPPHLDWWQGHDHLPLVRDGKGEFAGAAGPAGNATLAGSAPALAHAHEGYVVPVDDGIIVPEGTKSLVAVLNWTSASPGAKLGLSYRESNLPSEGPFELAKDGSGTRLFVLDVAAAQTDTTYSNRTTWEFVVLPDGAPAGAFQGSFTLVVWATKLEPGEAAVRHAPEGL